MYIARFSNHIQEDIKRNWSSFNFGEDGIRATEEELKQMKENAIKNDECIYISGLELYGKQILKTEIRELYENYWVVVDIAHNGEGIFGTLLESESLEDAIKEAEDADYSGDGYNFDANDFDLVHSIDNEIHIFKEK